MKLPLIQAVDRAKTIESLADTHTRVSSPEMAQTAWLHAGLAWVLVLGHLVSWMRS